MERLIRRVKDAGAYRLSPKGWLQAEALSRADAPRQFACERGVLSVTFDDFPASAWRAGGAILAEHGVRGTYFVSGALEGATVEGRLGFADQDLQGVHAAGHEIGCHTFSHANVQTLSAAALDAELDRNRAFVRDRLGQSFEFATFAYPLGLASRTAKARLLQRFPVCRGVFGGAPLVIADAGYVRATGLDRQHLDRLDIEALMARTAATRGWLVLYLHDVADRPSYHGCRPADLDRALRAARAAGLDVEPFGQAAGRLRQV